MVHHGAGLRLKPEAGPEAIARAVRRVIDEPSFAQNAGRIADAIAADETAEDSRLAELEEARRPLSALGSTPGPALSDPPRYTRPLP